MGFKLAGIHGDKMNKNRIVDGIFASALDKRLDDENNCNTQIEYLHEAMKECFNIMSDHQALIVAKRILQRMGE